MSGNNKNKKDPTEKVIGKVSKPDTKKREKELKKKFTNPSGGSKKWDVPAPNKRGVVDTSNSVAVKYPTGTVLKKKPFQQPNPLAVSKKEIKKSSGSSDTKKPSASSILESEFSIYQQLLSRLTKQKEKQQLQVQVEVPPKK